MSEHEPPSNPYQPGPPQGQPNQPYQSYGQPGPQWRPPPEHPQATLILVLGILGLVLCQVLGPFAWVMGGRARKEIQASNGTIGGDTQVTIGWILGIVASILLVVGVLVVALYLVGIAIFLGSAGGV